MSLLHTESFIAYPQLLTDDTFSAANDAAIVDAQRNLRRGGYETFARSSGTAANSGGFVVRADPVTAGRAALVHSSASGGTLGAYTAAIRKRLPLTRKTLIGGFSLYIPPEFVKSPAAGRVVCMRVTCPTGSAATWYNTPFTGNTVDELFRINSDLTIQWATTAPLSERALEPGRMAYIEYAVTDTEIRVWLDNVIVLQKSWSVVRESIAIMMMPTATPSPGTPPVGNAGRWAISNWYNLADDGLPPTSRLGPATRVIGVRPAVDVDVQFTRPSGVSSNAAVASQDLVDSPPRTLQAPSVGKQDIYASNLDTETAAGSLIHGIAVKVMAGSLDGAAHTIRPIIRTQIGTEAVQPGVRGLTTLPNIPGNPKVLDAAVRKSDGYIYAVTAAGIYECATGDGRSWSQPTALAALGTDATCVTCRPTDNVMFFGLKNGRGVALFYPAGNAGVSSGPASYVVTPVSITAAPSGHVMIGGINATWSRTLQTSGSPSWTGGTLSSATGNTHVTSDKLNNFFAVTEMTTPNVWRWMSPGYAPATIAAGLASFSNMAIASDGDQVSAFTSIVNSSSTYMRRSGDAGATWTDIITPNFNTAAFAQGSTVFAKGDEMFNQAGVFIGFSTGRIAFIGQSGTTIYGPELLSVNITAATVLASGAWMLFGLTGEVLFFDPQSIDVNLPAFSGFVPSVNFSTINPDTGAPWTPAEASVSQFGMRVTN